MSLPGLRRGQHDRHHASPGIAGARFKAADVFPMMTDAELKALGEDIKANGLKHP
jgi:hypothetical protein